MSRADMSLPDTIASGGNFANGRSSNRSSGAMPSAFFSGPPASSGSETVAALADRVRERLEPVPGAWTLGLVTDALRTEFPLLSLSELEAKARAVHALLTGLGPLGPLLEDPLVTDVMVNGAGPIWVERGGHLQCTDLELDEESLGVIVERILGPLGLRVDRSSPIVDARLPDGSRICVVVHPLAVHGTIVSIRRFAARTIPLTGFGSPEVTDLLAEVVDRRCNVVVFGATGAGKTTLLNALCTCLPPGERVITVEDTAELRLPGEHVVSLEARPANSEGVGLVTIRDLVRAALRLRPDRLVVGEARGAEALDLVAAMSTGHDGSLSTVHAGGAGEALLRLETLATLGASGVPLGALRSQIGLAVDVLVEVRRTSEGRRVTGVFEVRCADVEGGPNLALPLLEGGRRVRRLERDRRRP